MEPGVVRVGWSESALADLHEIYDYIARDAPRYARATVEKITGATALLAHLPKSGEVLHDCKAHRQVVVGNWRLIYREDEANHWVLIVGVIHRDRDVRILRGRQ